MSNLRWSIRFELSDAKAIARWAQKPAVAFEEWLNYLEFKWDQLEGHRQMQEGKQ